VRVDGGAVVAAQASGEVALLDAAAVERHWWRL
jgi:hypothetical protein